MRNILAPLAVVLLLVGIVAAASGTDEKTFTINPITYPDGTNGVAVVVVTNKLGPVVTVDYYNEDGVRHLGRYEDRSGGEVPGADDEAREFAFNHYFDKWQ